MPPQLTATCFVEQQKTSSRRVMPTTRPAAFSICKHTHNRLQHSKQGALVLSGCSCANPDAAAAHPQACRYACHVPNLLQIHAFSAQDAHRQGKLPPHFEPGCSRWDRPHHCQGLAVCIAVAWPDQLSCCSCWGTGCLLCIAANITSRGVCMEYSNSQHR
jgi:hypothetical protein